MAFSFHEYAHALVADKLGDPTPKKEGRLTTSPFKHIDILGFVFFLVAGFGWAKPVRTDSSHFKRPKRDLALVAASGPLTNLFLALFFAVALIVLFMIIDPNLIYTNYTVYIAYEFILSGIYLNILLFVLNLLPIPPLDGSRILYSILPDRMDKVIYFLESIGFYLLLVLIISGALDKILTPIISLIFNNYAKILQLVF